MKMDDRPRTAQIAHVLFVDVVGYSRQTTSAQSRLLARLNAAVEASAAYTEARAADAVHPFPTGDGMALVFTQDVIAPARCAAEVSRTLREGEALPVRMGIHSGLVQSQVDIAGRENVVGEGINTAQRVMDCGDAGHILLSAQYAAWLGQFEEWSPRMERLGEGETKHGQRLVLYSLRGEGFGRGDRPAKLRAEEAHPGTSGVPAEKAEGQQKVVVLYKRHLHPDEDVLHTVEEQLQAHGYAVFVDRHLRIGVEWARAIEEQIRSADAVIAIVSPRAIQSEMLEFEVETAHDQQTRTGKPLLLPVRVGEWEEVDGPVGAIIQPLHQFLWKGSEDDPRLVAELISAIQEPLKPRSEEVKLEPVGGAVPPDSPFYVVRPADREFLQALENRESILLVRGARQIGKTSLLAQGVKRVHQLGWRCAPTDFQKLSTAQMGDDGLFYRLLAATLARQLQFAFDFSREWDPVFGANLNMENFLRALLEADERPLVWFIDEADKVFGAPFASDFFGLVRSWHNSRSTEPGGCWDKLTVVIAYATEAHLFILDLNQSPFNVGRRLELEDFNLQQLLDLNVRYGGPLRSYEEAERLQGLIGGHPFLARKALDVLATEKADLTGLLEGAERDDGPFGDHLKRILVSVSQLPHVLAYVKALLEGKAGADSDAYYRLLSAGILKQERGGEVTFRCRLYRDYLQGHLQ
jgi:class 3 adenylate cyclase